MNTLMLSCRKATELMERRSMEALGIVERMQLWMHAQVCDGCRSFQKQNAQIDELMEEPQRTRTASDTTALEKRILATLDEDGSSNS